MSELIRELVETLEFIQRTEKLGGFTEVAVRHAIRKGRQKLADDHRLRAKIRRLAAQRKDARG